MFGIAMLTTGRKIDEDDHLCRKLLMLVFWVMIDRSDSRKWWKSGEMQL